MLKKITFLVISALVFNSCVSKKVYQELETKFNKLRSSNGELIQEKDAILAAKKLVEADLKKLNSEHDALLVEHKLLNDKHESLQNKFKNLEESYLALSKQSSSELMEQANKNEDLLARLEEKEIALA